MATRVSDRAEAILADYRSGMGARVVARRNSVSPKTVRNVLERLGEPTRNPSVAATRYSLDPAPFEADPLSPAAAYFVGLLLTDGCVLTPKTGSRKVKLSLAAEDAAIIGELRDFLRYTGPVRVYPPRRACPLNGSPTQGTVELLVTSGRLADALAGWGVCPRKTYTASADPRLLNSPHFWRGVVDGDGSVSSAGRRRVSLSVLSASRILIEQFMGFVRSVNPKTAAGPVVVKPSRDGYAVLYRGGVGDSQAAAVLSALYDTGGPSVARKRSAALAAIAARRDIEQQQADWACQSPGCDSRRRFTSRLCGTCHAADMKLRKRGLWRGRE